MTYWFLLGIAAVSMAVAFAGWRYSAHHSLTETARMLLICTAIVGFIGTLTLSSWFAAANIHRDACLGQGTKTHTTVRHQLLTGCRIRIDGRYIPYEQWVRVSGANTP